MIHGQEIDAIEFYLTNQDQQIQDLFLLQNQDTWPTPPQNQDNCTNSRFARK